MGGEYECKPKSKSFERGKVQSDTREETKKKVKEEKRNFSHFQIDDTENVFVHKIPIIHSID